MGLSPDDEIPQVSMSDLLAAGPEDKKGDEIAIYYAVGDIVDGVVAMPSRESVIDAQKVCADLQDLAKDKDVKAVVLRVNSPGGSAYASEQIRHQVMELKKVKPVVVSMGSYAASGGYYISCPANWIVAEPNTLTGSIGIFGMFPDVSGLLREKLGLKFDEVKTNKYALFGTRRVRSPPMSSATWSRISTVAISSSVSVWPMAAVSRLTRWSRWPRAMCGWDRTP